MIINNPHALYVNGEFVGIITNPDPVPGGMDEILNTLSYEHPNTSFDAVTIPTTNGWRHWSQIVESLKSLDVSMDVEPSPLSGVDDLDDDI